METDRLRQFCTVVETRSFSKAAEMLGISIGGLSKSISVLEQELGVKLFLPHGRGITPSDEAKAIYTRSKNVLDAVGALKAARDEQSHPFRVGALEVFTLHLIGEVVAAKFPAESLQVIETVPGALELAIQEGQIDCGITYLPRTPDDLDQIKIGSFELGAFSAKPLKFDDETPFVVPAVGFDSNPLGVRERDGWPDGLQRHKRYRVNMLSTGLDLARRGQAAVFMPDFVARLHNRTVQAAYRLEPMRLPLSVAQRKRDVFLIKRHSTVESPEFKKLAAGIRNVLSEKD